MVLRLLVFLVMVIHDTCQVVLLYQYKFGRSTADHLKKKDTCQVVGMYKKNRSWGETPPGHILEERYQAWNADRHRGFSDPQTPGFSALTKKLVGMYFCPFSSISLSKSFFSFLCLFDFLWFVVY